MPFPGNIIPQDRFDPAAVNIQKNFPIPNVPGAGNVNNYYSTAVELGRYEATDVVD